MTLNELYEKAKKMVEEGHGDAVIVHCDSRSGVTEPCHLSYGVEVVTGEESDFYVDLEPGDKYVEIFEGD